MNRKVELLAPAGNMEGFYGAVHAGADAVYLGGERFGARAYADNFTSLELLSVIRYAHIWNCRVYLTVNTLIKETELNDLPDYLEPLYQAGLDGVIVQDIGAFALMRELFPEMELHVSTQMTVTGGYGAMLLKSMGAVRVVPARELSLAEVKELRSASGLEVETFIHGAMCYCYSGQCLFSSILGGRSGNRGRCAQPCRLPYRVEYEGKISGECYPLSLKDMCTLENLPELMEAGIDSFKIEGRMKKPEYAAGVTAIYQKYIEQYRENGYLSVDPKDLQALGKLYIRSACENGYYHRHNGRDMVTLSDPSYSGNDETLLERIREEYLEKRPRKPVCIKAVFRVGERAYVLWSLGELQVRVDGEEVLTALNKPVTEQDIRKQLGKLGDTSFCVDQMEILLDQGIFYSLKAINDLRRRAVAELEEQLICANGFPVQRWMCLRHTANSGKYTLRTLTAEETISRDEPEYSANFSGDQSRTCGTFHVSVRTAEQLGALSDMFLQYESYRIVSDGVDSVSQKKGALPSRIYLEAELVQTLWYAEDISAYHGRDRKNEALSEKPRTSGLWEQLRALHDKTCELIIALPFILRSADEEFLERIWNIYCKSEGMFQGFLVRSVDGLGFLYHKKNMSGTDGATGEKSAGKYSAKIYTDAGFYIWNHKSLEQLQKMELVDGFCMPYELKEADQHRLLEQCSVPCEKVVYGRIPLMVTANCIVNTMEGCDKGKGAELCFLTDRYQKRFPVWKNCRSCGNIIYNSLPLSLHARLSKWEKKVDFRLDFTIESGQELLRILRYFLTGDEKTLPYVEYTTGHEKRGAD